MKEHNETKLHNATITARPLILFKTPMGSLSPGAFLQRRELTPEYFLPGTDEHKFMEVVTTEQDRNTLRAISLLRYAHEAGPDSATMAKALADAARILIPNAPVGDYQKLGLADLYSSLLTKGMTGSTLVMAHNVPAVLCPDLKAALYVASAYRSVAACANCRKLFALDAERVDGSASEKYCTASCGQKFRQRMYRLSLKTTKKRKAGKR
jgi:hypothetical protein